MLLTRSLREAVGDRARRNPIFVAALVEEAKRALVEGDTETARILLRDVANTTRPPVILAGPFTVVMKGLTRSGIERGAAC